MIFLFLSLLSGKRGALFPFAISHIGIFAGHTNEHAPHSLHQSMPLSDTASSKSASCFSIKTEGKSLSGHALSHRVQPIHAPVRTSSSLLFIKLMQCVPSSTSAPPSASCPCITPPITVL